MKYVKIDPFEKHLEEALPNHPSSLYFILMEDPFERTFVARRIAEKIGLPTEEVVNEKLLEVLEAPSLFSEKKVLICDELKEKKLPELGDWALILTGKTPPPFYKEMEKKGTILDLLGEKPWDRKTRLQKWLLETAREKGKALSAEGVLFLLSGSFVNFANLLQELEKAILYSGEEKNLTLKMLQTICTIDQTQSGWDLSEATVLGERAQLGEADLYGLIGQLRYQLQLGLQIASGKEEIQGSPKKLERFRKKGFPPSYFTKGLKDLFDLEMKMRSGISNQQLLFDQFKAKLAARCSC